MRIGDRLIGRDHPPLIVAEMSNNHQQSLDRALAIVEAAAGSGAHALKLQTATVDGLTLDSSAPDFVISDPASPWYGRRLYELYQQGVTPWEWHKPLFDRARELGLIAFSAPFEERAVDFLESLDVPCYKIASFENADLQIVRRAAATGKPLIISTGMATVAELDETVRAAREAGCTDFVLLKCTSTYPATPGTSNLLTIPHLREMFGCEVGLSDHTQGLGVSVASVALGATVIERHFTLSRADGGLDSSFSIEPAEMAQLVSECTRAWQALGAVHYGPTEAERSSVRFRRSLYITQDLKAGDTLTRENVRSIRPGFGLPPKFLNQVLGRKVRQDVPRGAPLSWDLLA
jgi:N-acetylneuraminate synthase